MTASAESSSRPAERPWALAAAGAALAVTAFLLAWALLHQGFYERDQIVDTPVYEKYGDWMAGGRLPYRDFRPEDPPLALPVFLVPSLVAGREAPLDEYSRVFEGLMALCGGGVIVATAIAARRLALGFGTLAFVALSPLAIGSVILTRFEIGRAHV